MKLKLKILYVFVLLQLIIPGALLALEPAPDITDREVVEKLAKLEAGQQAIQQALNQRISDLRSEMKSGQEALRSEMKSGQEALRSEMKSGQEALNKRLDDLSQRISDSNYTMVTIFGALVVLISVVLGLILWDRRTMLKPVVERVERIERDIVQDLDLSNADGSKLTRLINAIRELARTDEKLATVLRSFSLL